MTKFAYFNHEIVPIGDAKISVMTHTFNYGTGCFGGIRAYWNAEKEQLFAFRLIDHYRRFLNSARLMRTELDYTPEALAAITVELLAREGWRENCYVRPIAYKADEKIGVRTHGLQDAVTIFSVPMGDYLHPDGVHAGVSSWRRVDDNAIPARGKIIGAYANSALIKSDAILAGFDEAIVLNQDGHVSEGSAANFMMMRDGVLITPPVTDNILEGIVRGTLLHLARTELGLAVQERPIDRSELYLADEALFCGTGVQVTPVVAVDHRPLGSGQPGPVTERLRERYFDIMLGNDERYMEWLTPVPNKVKA